MPFSQLALALLVPLLWGLGFVFAKAGLSEFPPLLLMGMRFCLTAIILLPFVKMPRGHLIWIAALAFIGSTIQYGLTFTGLKHMDASLAIIVVQLEVPFGVIMGALLFREHVGWQKILGILLAFAGVALIAGMPEKETALWPALLVVGGAFTWAVSQIMVKQMKGAVNGFTLIAWVGLFAGPQMLLGSFLFEQGQWEAVQTATWIGWSTVVYLAVMMTAIGYSIWFHVLNHNPVTQVMPVLLLLPVVGVIGSVVILGEKPGFMTLVGGLIVILGVSLIIFTRERSRG